jgi:thioesterase domain-containing protein
MRDDSSFGARYLQDRIDREIMLAKPMGVIVESADEDAVVLRAPLAANANHKGTAFGGSQYSLAVLAGWAWLSRYLAAHEIGADGVIQESGMRFLAPLHGELRARAAAPAAAQIDSFLRMLRRAGRGRIRLGVEVYHGQVLTAVFDGLFAAAMHRQEG